MRSNDCSEFNDGLVAILASFEALSEMLAHFVQAYQGEPSTAAFITSLIKAMQASDSAAELVRERLRGGVGRGA